MRTYRYILFDIDGVLAHPSNSWDGALKESNLTEEMFFKNWDSSTIVEAFETGKVSVEEFAKKRAQELGCVISPERVKFLLMARKSVLFEGVESMLTALHAQGQAMACLSNTNILHWQGIENKEVFDRCFSKKFLSFEIGLAKPSREAYQHVLDVLECQPREILYFDDSEKNIAATLSMNFSAVRVRNFQDITDSLAVNWRTGSLDRQCPEP
jgi:putative hydrolase of the HAD superfamily